MARQSAAVLAVVGLVVAMALAPNAAHATSQHVTTASCASLTTALAGASSPGDTVAVDGGLHFTCGAISLPTHIVHLIGLGAGPTFTQMAGDDVFAAADIDATSIANVTLVGEGSGSAADVHGIEISGVSAPILTGDTFSGFATTASGASGQGAAVLITGASSVTLATDTFTGNRASSDSTARGGALSVVGTGGATSISIVHCRFAANTATASVEAEGGAVYLDVDHGATVNFSDNIVTGNSADSGGGGLAIDSEQDSSRTIDFDDNEFDHNTLTSTAGDHEGAGIALENIGGNSGVELRQTDNLFTGNAIPNAGPGGEQYGGGEYVSDFDLTSSRDRFSANTMAAADTALLTQGAGLWVGGDACGAVRTAALVDDEVTSNRVTGGPGNGVGVYAGCSGPSAIQLTILDTTIAGNATGSGGVAGIWGGGNDELIMRNSIDTQNVGGLDLDGFAPGAIVADHSAVCADLAMTVAFAGAGNLCAAPAFIDAANGDFHLGSGPGVDAGDASELPAGLVTDRFGGQRITGAQVDMGDSELAMITVNPTAVVPGATVTVTGSGFAAGEPITLALGDGVTGSPLDGATVTTSASGAFAIRVVIPAPQSAGATMLRALGQYSGDRAFAALTLTPPAAAATAPLVPVIDPSVTAPVVVAVPHTATRFAATPRRVPPSTLSAHALGTTGIVSAVACTTTCRLVVRVFVSAAQARRLGLHTRVGQAFRPVLVGHASSTISVAGVVTVRVNVEPMLRARIGQLGASLVAYTTTHGIVSATTRRYRVAVPSPAPIVCTAGVAGHRC